MTDEKEEKEPAKENEVTRKGYEKTPARLAHEEKLKEANKATRFDGENANPRYTDNNGNKPWSIRNSLKYLARQPIDMNDPKAMHKILPEKPTVAQVIAANALAKATKADMRAVEYATEQIDGKLAQTNINADFAALQGMTDDELRAIADGVNSAAEASSGTAGTESPGGGQGDAAGENAGADAPANPAGI